MNKTGVSDLLKSHLGPAGDLYLSRTKAIQLIRWLETIEKLWRDQEVNVKDLYDALKIFPREI